jgi:hypothetical protein
MNTDEPRAVLAELAGLAARHDWAHVSGFLAELDAADGREILVASAPGVHPRPLGDWLRYRSGSAPVRTTDLDGLVANPGPALASGRVVIALRCGDLLMPPTIAGAAVIRRRPAGSYAIVLTGADLIQTESDLATAQRAVSGALLDQAGAGRTGRGLLLWSDAGVAPFLAERIAADMAELERWLAAGAAPSAGLDLPRAVHALALAEEDNAAAPAPQSGTGAEHARVLPALRSSVASLHTRVLDHLDAEAASLVRELRASLDTVRHELLRDIRAHAGSPDPRWAGTLVTQRLSRWCEESDRLIAARQAQSGQHATELLDVIDWPLVNQLAPGGRNPESITQLLAPGQHRVPYDSRFTPPAAAPAPGTAWGPALGTAAVGGVVTAAALAIMGVALVPVIGAAAAGVAAATLVGARRGPVAGRQQTAATALDTAVRDELSKLASAVSAQLDADAATVRATADARFTELERALAAAEEQARQVHDGAMNSQAEASEQLAGLRSRLATGAASPADRANLRH